MQATYTAVMQKVNASNRSAFEALLKVYRETDLSQEKGRIIGNNITYMSFDNPEAAKLIICFLQFFFFGDL